jgi:hypothetical protein
LLRLPVLLLLLRLRVCLHVGVVDCLDGCCVLDD